MILFARALFDVLISSLWQGALIATIIVNLSASGSVTGAWIKKSSGRSDLDHSALEAAVKTTYAPGMRNCKPVAGAYESCTTFSQGGN